MSVRTAALLLAGLASAAGCGARGAPALPPGGTQSPPPYTGPAGLASFQWNKRALDGAQYIGPAHFGAAGVDVAVHMRNEAGLLRYAQEVSIPASPFYRNFLTPREIADRFGASQRDYAAAAAYFQKFGLHVGGWTQREMLFVSGAQTALESAFGTRFGVYRKGAKTFVAPMQTPHFQVSVPVTAVANLVQLQPMGISLVRGVPASSYRGYSPQQIARAFDFTGAYRAGFTGRGINVSIVGSGPISAADTAMLSTVFHTRVGVVREMPVTDSGVAAGMDEGGGADPHWPGLQSPPPLTAPCDGPLPQCNDEDDEAQIDTETVASLAPDATTLFYLAYNPNKCPFPPSSTPATPCPDGDGHPAQGYELWGDELEQIIADDKADVVSISMEAVESRLAGYAYDAQGAGFGPTIFATLAAEGIAVFVCSDDWGAYALDVSAPAIAYPSGDPNVVSVGGVNAPIDGSGRLTGQITGWGDATSMGGDGTFANNVGSGGGFSAVFAAPAWQRGIVPFGKSASLTMRATPDVALLGDPYSAAAIAFNASFPGSQSLQPWAGTSLAAPQMAAMWALVLQACAQTPSCATAGGAYPYRLGNPAPLLYRIAVQQPSENRVFYDVLAGDNSARAPEPGSLEPGYRAGPGYDLVTGLGVPFAAHLIEAVTGRNLQ